MLPNHKFRGGLIATAPLMLRTVKNCADEFLHSFSFVLLHNNQNILVSKYH